MGEYRNQNSNRSYPFADDASLLDADGNALPSDFIIDAFLFPIDVGGGVYLQSIDTVSGKIYFAADGTPDPFGIATYAGTDTAYVYETGTYGRQIGVVVFGAGTNQIVGGTAVRTFTYEATALTPAAFIPMNQPGVRGILLEDGSLLTGDITIVGGPGVNITSFGGTNSGWVVFDFVGTLPPTPDDCGDPNPLIKRICFDRNTNSLFSLSLYTGGIALSGYGFNQDDICKAQRSVSLPDENGNLPPQPTETDPCKPGPPPPPPSPGVAQHECVDLADLPGSTLLIVTPSGGSMLNVVAVVGVRGVFGQSFFVQAKPVESISELANQFNNFTDPPLSSDALRISIKGLSTYKRSTT